MTINVAGLLDNVQQSLDAYLGALGYAVHQHGVRRFVPPTTEAWIKVRYDLLQTTRQFYRQVSLTEVGDEVRGTLELTLCQHARTFTQRYTLAAVRDAVMAALTPSDIVPINDYTGGGAQVGVLLLYTVSERLLDDGGESGLVQHSMSVETRYIEAATQPF